MASRLYLRDTNVNAAAAYARTTKSVQSMNVDGGHAIRDLSLTKGAAETSLVTNTLNSASTQQMYWCKFISPRLGVTQIDQNIWTLALAGAESSVNANMLTPMQCCYVLTETDTKRGAIFDTSSAPTGGVELSTTEDGQVLSIATTFTSAVANCLTTDRLCYELWGNGTISMAGVYAITYWFNGATDVLGTTTTDAASYLETPQNNLFASGVYIADTITDLNQTASTSQTVRMPANVQVGDLLYMAIGLGGSTSITAGLTGWTADATATIGTNKTLRTYYRVADGTESTLTLTLSASQKSSSIVARIVGADTTTPLDTTTLTNSPLVNSASATTSAITTAHDGALVVAGVIVDADTAATIGTATNMSEVNETAGVRNAMDYATQATAGTFASQTATISVATLQWMTFTAAIRPAGAAPASAPYIPRRRSGIAVHRAVH